MESINAKFLRWLKASYLYYIKFEDTGMLDTEYDHLAQELLLSWDEVEHPMKELVDKPALIAGSLYFLREDQYTDDVKS